MYSAWVVLHQGWNVSLVTVKPSSADSRMFHHPNIEWTRLQAQAMGLSHEFVESTSKNEMADLRYALAALKSRQQISGIVTGAVASDYQKTRFDNMCDSIALKTYAPLWHKNPKLLVEDLKKSGLRIVLTAVAANGLDESWLGRELTEQQCVLDAPYFSKTIEIEKSRKEWHGDSGRMVIEEASLRDKPGN